MPVDKRSASLGRIATFALVVWMSAATAFAQTVRVTRDKSTIWRADAPSVVLTVVAAGTALEVIDRQGVWLRVRLPATAGDPIATGLILASAVEPISGAGQPKPVPARPGQVVRPGAERLVIRGFGEVGFLRLAATKSFNAIFGKDTTWLPGAGVHASWPNGSFAAAEVEWFRLTGQRAFVLDSQVFPLGIEDVVTVIPVQATFGYQIGRSQVARPYFGAGFGLFFFRERAKFAQTGDDVSQRFPSYHAVVGVDLVRRRRISTAIEAQYSTVRKAIGKSGVSAGFNETDLGGTTVRMKVLVR
ncbi:MAG: hypothetical protein ACRD2N_12665 [Vicinamibacterales bacterium]